MHVQRRTTSAWPRLVLVAMGLCVAAVEGSALVVLPWALLVLALDLSTGWLVEHRPRSAVGIHPALALEVLAAGILGTAIGVDLSGTRGLLPLLLVPAFRAGVCAGRVLTVIVVALSGLLMFGVDRFDGGSAPAPDLSSSVLWLGLALATGLIGAWVRGVESAPAHARAAQDAAALLRRLGSPADTMDGSVDAPACAELMLAELGRAVLLRRAAVLVGLCAGPAVPLAVRGCEQVPWPDPDQDGSPLHGVWSSGTSLVTSWASDGVERSILATVLHDAEGGQIGALVADREGCQPFTPRDLAAMEKVVQTHGGNIDLALSFAALREHAGMEERERLAGEMHDGIAQELVALGYRIDIVRRQLRSELPRLSGPLDAVRADLTHVLADVRLRIADLRLAVRPDRGLGAIIGDRLQRFGATSELSVTLRLDETGFRLPAHTETALYRLLLHVLEDARHAPGATEVEVNLTVAAPQAFLRISHDGCSELRQERLAQHPLTGLGGEILVDQLPDRGVVVQVYLHRSRGSAPRPLTPERIS